MDCDLNLCTFGRGIQHVKETTSHAQVTTPSAKPFIGSDFGYFCVANRIRAAMARDAERPQLSASIGISIYNGHGERMEKVLSDADAKLYTEKARRDKQSHL